MSKRPPNLYYAEFLNVSAALFHNAFAVLSKNAHKAVANAVKNQIKIVKIDALSVIKAAV